MANLKQSKKRIKQDIKRRSLNKSKLSEARTYIKNFQKLISLKKFSLASLKYRLLVSKIDKIVRKGIHKKRKASRLKSRLSQKLKIANMSNLKGM